MIGRTEEQKVLERSLHTGRSEFLAVYGRRRVGKTYLIKEFFKYQFSFYVTGVPSVNTRQQLKVFHNALREYGDDYRRMPMDWLDAFSRLKRLLMSDEVYRDSRTGKKIVFIDEIPWMDTARSEFKSSLDYFWNSWGADQKDLLFIICGSATSWVINNIIEDTGGFYGRVTQQLQLLPFTLSECERLLADHRMRISHERVVEYYMVFGGIPYYLNYLNPSLSLAQNIDSLLLNQNGPLHNEFQLLFSSLFRKPGNHLAVVEALAKNNSGLSRKYFLENKIVSEGKELTKVLSELEYCGFIRKYLDFTKNKSGYLYRLIDSFCLFHLWFVETGKIASWAEYMKTPAYYSWCGFAFERVCFMHVPQIKKALGISGVSSQVFSWRSKKASPGAQIDLLIDRKDDVINLCEIKYTSKTFAIDADYNQVLKRKEEIFREETKTKKSLYTTMITNNGLTDNEYKLDVQNEITLDDLF